MAGLAERIRKAWTGARPGLDRWLIRLIGFGVFGHSIILVTPFGSNDTSDWGEFADGVLAHGLIGAYERHEFSTIRPWRL